MNIANKARPVKCSLAHFCTRYNSLLLTYIPYQSQSASTCPQPVALYRTAALLALTAITTTIPYCRAQSLQGTEPYHTAGHRAFRAQSHTILQGTEPSGHRAIPYCRAQSHTILQSTEPSGHRAIPYCWAQSHTILQGTEPSGHRAMPYCGAQSHTILQGTVIPYCRAQSLQHTEPYHTAGCRAFRAQSHTILQGTVIPYCRAQSLQGTAIQDTEPYHTAGHRAILYRRAQSFRAQSHTRSVTNLLPPEHQQKNCQLSFQRLMA